VTTRTIVRLLSVHNGVGPGVGGADSQSFPRATSDGGSVALLLSERRTRGRPQMMDEAQSDVSHRDPSVEDIHATHRPHGILDKAETTAPSPGRATRSRRNLWLVKRSGSETGIVWVRASDLLSSGTGRIAGRGLHLEAELTRRVRRTPAATRRAIRERADRLPPLSAFGRGRGYAPISRAELGRD